MIWHPEENHMPPVPQPLNLEVVAPATWRRAHSEPVNGPHNPRDDYDTLEEQMQPLIVSSDMARLES